MTAPQEQPTRQESALAPPPIPEHAAALLLELAQQEPVGPPGYEPKDRWRQEMRRAGERVWREAWLRGVTAGMAHASQIRIMVATDQQRERLAAHAADGAADVDEAWQPPRLTDEQRAALIRHGYDPDLPPRGVTGPADGVIEVRRLPDVDGQPRWRKLRNRVCKLDGIEIDGHEGSDLDPGGEHCIHCGGDLLEFYRE